MRVKRLSTEQFGEIQKRQWLPVELVADAIPEFLRNIPNNVLHRVMASGVKAATEAYSSHRIPSGFLVGGIDVYRQAPDDPVQLNKDWYAVVSVPGQSEMLLVDGPIPDDEHWLNEIPNRLHGAEILGIPKS